jgi:hypothetical protein
MARLWLVAFFSACLVVASAHCKPQKPHQGQPCSPDGKLECVDAAGGLLCRGGVFVALPCRGPRGCRGTGAGSTCDDGLAEEGDPCVQTVNENVSCAVDRTRQLVCKDGVFVAQRACKGPKRCAVNGDVVSCDDTFGEVGDPCKVEDGENNYRCAADKSLLLACDPATHTFTAYESCRGPKGCTIEADRVVCDDAMARAGDRCHSVGDHTCSEDARSELQCSAKATSTWVLQRECTKACKIAGNQVYCE